MLEDTLLVLALATLIIAAFGQIISENFCMSVWTGMMFFSAIPVLVSIPLFTFAGYDGKIGDTEYLAQWVGR